MNITTIVSWSILGWFCFALGSCYITLCDSENGNGFPKCRWQACILSYRPKIMLPSPRTQKSWPRFHPKWWDFFTSWWNWVCKL